MNDEVCLRNKDHPGKHLMARPWTKQDKQKPSACPEPTELIILGVLCAIFSRARDLLKFGWTQGKNYASAEDVECDAKALRVKRFCLWAALNTAHLDLQQGFLIYVRHIQSEQVYFDMVFPSPHADACQKMGVCLHMTEIAEIFRRLNGLQVSITAYNDNPNQTLSNILQTLQDTVEELNEGLGTLYILAKQENDLMVTVHRDRIKQGVDQP